MAASASPLDTLKRYHPFDFRAKESSLKTAFPHLRDNRAQVERIIGIIHPYFTTLSARLTAEYQQLGGLAPNIIAKKFEEYKLLGEEFTVYTTWLENAESYLRDLRFAIEQFGRDPICPADLLSLSRWDPEEEKRVEQLQTTVRMQVAVLKKQAEEIQGLLQLARDAQKKADEALGWFGKAAAGNGSLGAVEWLRQWAKPRQHAATPH